MTIVVRGLLAAAVVVVCAPPAAAQMYEAVGTRAQGMGGAFVAVADDATATWWNPAGLATGASLSFVWDMAENLAPADPRPEGPASLGETMGFALTTFLPWASAITACESVKCSPFPLHGAGSSADKKKGRQVSVCAHLRSTSSAPRSGSRSAATSSLASTLKLIRGGRAVDRSGRRERSRSLEHIGDLDLSMETRTDSTSGRWRCCRGRCASESASSTCGARVRRRRYADRAGTSGTRGRGVMGRSANGGDADGRRRLRT